MCPCFLFIVCNTLKTVVLSVKSRKLLSHCNLDPRHFRMVI